MTETKITIAQGDDPTWDTMFQSWPEVSSVTLETYEVDTAHGTHQEYDLFVTYDYQDDLFCIRELQGELKDTLLELWYKQTPEAFED